MRRLWIGLAATLLLTGAALADRLSAPRPPLPPPAAAANPGGVWACPVLKQPGGYGWLHMVNSGAKTSSVRVTYVIDGKRSTEQAVSLQAGRTATIATPASMKPLAAGAIVEYAGGDVTIARTTQLGDVAGAAACSRPGPATLVIPQGSTFKADTQIVLLNPGGSDAVVDVTLSAGGRSIAPESLTGRVVPARRRLVLREGDFAFDTKNVGATIAASAGRVVADGVLEAGSAVDLIPAVSPARSVSVIGSSARGTLLFSAMGIGDDDAVTDANVITTNGPTTFGPLVTALAPDTPILAAAGGDAPGTAALTIGSSTAFLAIGSRWQVKTPDGSVEWAVATGAPPSRHLVAVIGPPASVAALHLLVANVDDVPAIVDVEVLTETGPIEVSALQDVVVPGGGTSSLRVRGVPATATVGLVIRSSRGRIVAAVEAVTSRPGSSAYAIIGVPAVVSPEVAVVADPRQGVPGP